MRLYRYFETASTIYLLLEYARGGRLWNHLSCHQRSKESYDYATGDPTERNAQNSVDKLTHAQTEKKTAAERNAAIVNRLATKPLDNRNSNLSTNSAEDCDSQVSKDSEKIPRTSLENTDQLATNNMDGITVPCNGNNSKAVTGTTEVREVNSESVDKCSETSVAVSRDNKHSLFVKLDEYFASSVQHVPNEHAKIWAAELVLAVAYLHTAGIICRYYFLYECTHFLSLVNIHYQEQCVKLLPTLTVRLALPWPPNKHFFTS